jgi:hypothetical protein
MPPPTGRRAVLEAILENRRGALLGFVAEVSGPFDLILIDADKTSKPSCLA